MSSHNIPFNVVFFFLLIELRFYDPLAVSLPNNTFPGQVKSSKQLTSTCALSFTRN